MTNLNLNNAEFIISAANKKDFPRNGLPQIVFSGRSNVGKSSVINKILGRKNLARVGASPGKTTHINFFLIDKRAYFTDLPGYGYAKVSQSERDRWGRLIEEYFNEPGLIRLGIMIVDHRHKPTADDVTMAAWFRETGMPFAVVANKHDKLKKSEIEPARELIRQTLGLDNETAIVSFSAEKGTGRDELISLIMSSLSGEEL